MVALLQSHFNGDSVVNILLSDACQPCAELSNLRVNGGFDVGLPHCAHCLRPAVHNHHREFNYFLKLQVLVSLVRIFTSALEVKDAQVVYGGLVHILFGHPVNH